MHSTTPQSTHNGRPAGGNKQQTTDTGNEANKQQGTPAHQNSATEHNTGQGSTRTHHTKSQGSEPHGQTGTAPAKHNTRIQQEATRDTHISPAPHHRQGTDEEKIRYQKANTKEKTKGGGRQQGAKAQGTPGRNTQNARDNGGAKEITKEKGRGEEKTKVRAKAGKKRRKEKREGRG